MICGLCKKWKPGQSGKRGRIQALFDHWKRECGENLGWDRVVKLRQSGQLATADRIAKRLMGVQEKKKKVMTPEARAQVDEYNRLNQPKILQKRRLRRAAIRQMKQSSARHGVDITRKKI